MTRHYWLGVPSLCVAGPDGLQHVLAVPARALHPGDHAVADVAREALHVHRPPVGVVLRNLDTKLYNSDISYLVTGSTGVFTMKLTNSLKVGAFLYLGSVTGSE